MAENDLTLAHSLQTAHTSLVANLLADGALPPTAAGHQALALDVGSIVRDRVTGLYGVVHYVAVQEIQRQDPR